MATSNSTRSPIIYLDFSGSIAIEIFQSLNLMVDQTTTETIRQVRTEDTDRGIAASDERILISTPNNMELLLSRPIKTKRDPAPAHQIFFTGKLENKPALPQNWQWLVNLSPVKKNVSREKIIDMLSRHKDLWSGSQGTIKATFRTIDLKDYSRLIRRQVYSNVQKAKRKLCEHIDKVEADLVEVAQLKWARPIVLVPKKNILF